MQEIKRRQGKSVLPKLLKEFGFDKAAPKKEESVYIVFDEGDAICQHIAKFPVPIFKSGEIFTYSTPFNEAVATESKEKPDKIK